MAFANKIAWRRVGLVISAGSRHHWAVPVQPPRRTRMNLYQRTRRVLKREGMTGLMRRWVWRTLGAPPPPVRPGEEVLDDLRTQIPWLKAEYEQCAAEFAGRVRSLGLDDVSRFYWYHTIDLGNGLVTPGDYDFRADVPLLHFPEDLRGKKVLDVGSATGFFAFELEKRGAEVVSVELPSLKEWDMPLDGSGDRAIEGLCRQHGTTSPEEAHHLHLDGPFQFCRKVLGSSVRRCFSSVYDLSPAALGCDGFDLVFVGDVLIHLMAPLKALAVLAPLCRGTMVITQELNEENNPAPVARFVGEEADCRSWWYMNHVCLDRVLKRLGFRETQVVGHVAGLMRRVWDPYRRAIIHAHK
jgi:tRNA (mo5U34)-methyltransferase